MESALIFMIPLEKQGKNRITENTTNFFSPHSSHHFSGYVSRTFADNSQLKSRVRQIARVSQVQLVFGVHAILQIPPSWLAKQRETHLGSMIAALQVLPNRCIYCAMKYSNTFGSKCGQSASNARDY